MTHHQRQTSSCHTNLWCQTERCNSYASITGPGEGSRSIRRDRSTMLLSQGSFHSHCSAYPAWRCSQGLKQYHPTSTQLQKAFDFTILFHPVIDPLCLILVRALLSIETAQQSLSLLIEISWPKQGHICK